MIQKNKMRKKRTETIEITEGCKNNGEARGKMEEHERTNEIRAKI